MTSPGTSASHTAREGLGPAGCCQRHAAQTLPALPAPRPPPFFSMLHCCLILAPAACSSLHLPSAVSIEAQRGAAARSGNGGAAGPVTTTTTTTTAAAAAITAAPP